MLGERRRSAHADSVPLPGSDHAQPATSAPQLVRQPWQEAQRLTTKRRYMRPRLPGAGRAAPRRSGTTRPGSEPLDRTAELNADLGAVHHFRPGDIEAHSGRHGRGPGVEQRVGQGEVVGHREIARPHPGLARPQVHRDGTGRQRGGPKQPAGRDPQVEVVDLILMQLISKKVKDDAPGDRGR